MGNLGHFDPSQVKDERQLMPDGTYAAQVIESDVVPTKAGNGQILKLTWEIIEGPLERRRVWDQINIANQNAQAQEIGQRQLKRLCEALGLGPIGDSKQLEFKPVRIRVGTQKGEGGYDDRNVVKGFEPYPGRGPGPARETAQNPAPQTAYQPPAQQRAAAGGGGSMPWRQ